MLFDALTSHPKRLVWRAYQVFVALALGLLTACGGGGGGGGNPAPPTLTLTWSNAPANSTVAAGTPVTLMAMYTYGDATINWTDEAGVNQTRKLAASGSTETFTPNKTTTYTLVSNYQGVSATPVTVNVTPPVATLSLTPVSNPILKGASTLLTPSFSCTGGTITQSVINDGTNDIQVSSGTAIQVTPTVTTTYTLRVKCQGTGFEAPAVVTVIDGPPKFTLGANLNTARSNHIAVLLPNNLVLVAGGTNGTTSLKSAELYDPVKNTWTATGDMNTARVNHSAVLMLNNKVLVTGGFDGTAALKTAEVYDPSTGKWTTTTAGMAFSHVFHTSTVLADTVGSVLIAGGVLGPSNNADATSTEVYSPTADAFTAGPKLPEPRQGHTTTVLKSGKILLVGNSNGNAAKAVVLPDAAPASVAVATGALNFGRYNHAASLLSNGSALTNGMVLVTGGFGNNPKSTELYNPTDNHWYPAGNMNEARALHTSTLLRNGKVLIIGGYNYTSGTLSTIEIFDPAVFSFSTPQTSWSTLPKVLNTARAAHTSTLLSNDNVLVVGTYLQGGGTPSASTEIWAP
jgi:N-acetylneuraminic acid mutarotase